MPIQSKSELGTPILTASMVAQFEAGIASNDENAAGANTRDGGFVNGRFAEIFFNGELTADNGLVYGAKIHFSTSSAAGSPGGGAQTNGFPGREYIYLSGGWGSMEFGNWIGADSGLNLCLTCNTYAGYGGLDTPWKSYIQNPNGNYRNGSVNPFWFDQSAKVTYYTPVFAGFQAGVSYTASTKPFFAASPTTADNDGNFKDVVGFGVQWNGDFNGVGVAVSAVGATSDGSRTAAVPSAAATTGAANLVGETAGLGYYELGAVVRYAGFQFGGSYWDSGNGGASRIRDYGYERDGWTLDAAYFFGPYGIELQYMHSSTDASNRLLTQAVMNTHTTTGATGLGLAPSAFTETYEVDAWAVSFGYSVAPGLKWYAEVVGADFDFSPSSAAVAAGVSGANPSNLENSAVAAITGLVLSF